MHKSEWSSLKVVHRVFHYVKFWKSVFPTMFKYRGDIAKQVTNRLYVAVFILIHIPQLSRHLNESLYTWTIWRVIVHAICFVTFCMGAPELWPFFKKLTLYIKFMSQTSSTVMSSLFFLNVFESQNSYIQ